MYYLIINKLTKEYYCNKSRDPQKSIDTHIRRANNPNSKNYNTPLHIALREQGLDNFIFYKLEELPDWIESYKKYLS